ncbi:MAG: hypothetical protein ACJ75F_01315 [Flavisolibacter sp.]
MINVKELRLGNYLLQKVAGRVSTVRCAYHQFELVSKEGTKDLYPVLLNADVLLKCGFEENKNYPLLPEARQFILVVPVIGSSRNEIHGFVKNNKECFGRATVNGLPASNNFYHLHQLQNLFFALTAQELPVILDK